MTSYGDETESIKIKFLSLRPENSTALHGFSKTIVFTIKEYELSFLFDVNKLNLIEMKAKTMSLFVFSSRTNVCFETVSRLIEENQQEE